MSYACVAGHKTSALAFMYDVSSLRLEEAAAKAAAKAAKAAAMIASAVNEAVATPPKAKATPKAAAAKAPPAKEAGR